MKRSVKNFIVIVCIVLMVGVCFYTMKHVQNNLSSQEINNFGGNGNMEKFDKEFPNEMPDNSSNLDENSSKNSDSVTSEDTTNTDDKLQKDEGATTQKSSSKSNKKRADMNPKGGENNNNSENAPDGNAPDGMNGMGKPDFNNENGNKPNGNMPDSKGFGGNPPSGNPGEGMKMDFGQGTKSLTTPYYIAFCIESFIISLLVIYLVMSNLNKKSLKETFDNKSKVIVYILLSAIVTLVIFYLAITITNNEFLNSNTSNGNNVQMQKSSSSNVTYSAAKEITSSDKIDSGEFTSSNPDENAVLVTGDADVELSNITVNKTGDSSGSDENSFYGNNSAVLAKDGANVTINNVTVETSATGANGIFSYGGTAKTENSSSDGTTVTISDSKITTKGNSSGGIMTTGGGKTIAKNLTISTEGTSSAAIRSDRGGGTVEVTGGTYETSGQGSPAIYSTADIIVKDATLTATASEGIVIEGANNVSIENCKLTDTNNKLNGSSTTYKNIFMYQSMSGDASSNGNSEFIAKNSEIVTNKGDTLYVTNTTANISLENNKITNNDKEGNFLRVQKDSWGKEGANGGVVTLTAKNQEIKGDIVVDEISTLDMSFSNNTKYEGSINKDNTAKEIKLKLDKTSTLKLTGNCYVTSLEDEDTSYSNIDLNGFKLYVNGKEIN